MKYVNGFKCTICNTVFEKSDNLLTCPKCGEKGILDVLYDYDRMKTEVTKNYFNSNKDFTMLRYTPLMSINLIKQETLKVGWTPLYKTNNLGRKLGLNRLYVKDEGLNPTASLKDRASLVACIKAIENNQQIICCSSTGNAASSLAGNAAKLGLKSLIFVPKRAPIGKLAQLVTYGANLIKIDGDYKQTFNASKEAIDKFGLYNRNAAINPHLVEGKKTVAFEIAEQLDFKDIDNVIVSVGDGCTIGAVYKGFYDLYNLDLIASIPRIIGVQSEGCSPFYTAWKTNTKLVETEENTIADSIAVGIPRNPVKGLNAVKKTDGLFITVTDDEILEATSELGKTEGIFTEPAASASIAGLIKLVKENKISKDDITVVIATGNGLKDQSSILSRVNNVPVITAEKLIKDIFSKCNKNEVDKVLRILKTDEVKKDD
jgi:threonine synthase